MCLSTNTSDRTPEWNLSESSAAGHGNRRAAEALLVHDTKDIIADNEHNTDQ